MEKYEEKVKKWDKEFKKIFGLSESVQTKKEEQKEKHIKKKEKYVNKDVQIALDLVNNFKQQKKETIGIKQQKLQDKKIEEFELIPLELRNEIILKYKQSFDVIDIRILAELFDVSLRSIYKWCEKSHSKYITLNGKVNINLFSDVLKGTRNEKHNIKMYKIFKNFIHYINYNY